MGEFALEGLWDPEGSWGIMGDPGGYWGAPLVPKWLKRTVLDKSIVVNGG